MPFQAEIDEAVAEQHAPCVQEHCLVLIKTLRGFGRPFYTERESVASGDEVIVARFVQRINWMLFAASIAVELTGDRRVVSRVEMIDLENYPGIQEERTLHYSHRFTDQAERGLFLSGLYPEVRCAEPDRVLLCYERADMDDRWKMSTNRIHKHFGVRLLREDTTSISQRVMEQVVSLLLSMADSFASKTLKTVPC